MDDLIDDHEFVECRGKDDNLYIQNHPGLHRCHHTTHGLYDCRKEKWNHKVDDLKLECDCGPSGHRYSDCPISELERDKEDCPDPSVHEPINSEFRMDHQFCCYTCSKEINLVILSRGDDLNYEEIFFCSIPCAEKGKEKIK